MAEHYRYLKSIMKAIEMGKFKILVCAFFSFAAAMITPTVKADTLKFSGLEWKIKDGEKMGPGPNSWSKSNVFVDADGRLHLKISQRDGKWQCAEVNSLQRFGFGTYQWEVVGRPDLFDQNIVLGLFNYPPPDVGADGTNEIDIEFAHWGKATSLIGNYTLWPASKSIKYSTHPFKFMLNGDYTTHRFRWDRASILFESLHGHRVDNNKNKDDKSKDDSDGQGLYEKWLLTPVEGAIPQKPMPVFINFWLFRGQAPSDGKEAEIIIKSFKFTPLVSPKS